MKTIQSVVYVFLNSIKKRFMFLLVSFVAILLLIMLSIVYLFSPERGKYSAIQLMRSWEDLYLHDEL